MRAFWGTDDKSHRILKRKYRVRNNIKRLLKNPFNKPFVTYVFGRDNYNELVKLGCDCILLSEEPFMFDLVKYQYRHKLEAIRWAFENEGVDELVHFDWDCYPCKKLPQDFWEVLGKKEAFQANLILYHRKKATWRKIDRRKIPNGGFVYIRNKQYPSDLIKVWETMISPSAEPAMAKFTDNLMGGWQGVDKYWDLFEPDFCNLHHSSPFTKEQLKSKNHCFTHYQGGH